VVFSGSEVTLAKPAPGLGEHTDAVLDAAGYDPERIARLRAEGVL
jgi:crotonobetainyl-CoA:carnitine CoA-transferase CaiB-like acyl-CoA transferase